VTPAKRRGYSEVSKPRRRADGRWQINLRVTDEDGDSQRFTVYGTTAKETRDKAAAIRARVLGGRPATDRWQTVQAFAQRWTDTTLQASERKQNSKGLYAGFTRTHVHSSSLGRLTLDRVRPSHV
jgi:integrase